MKKLHHSGNLSILEMLAESKGFKSAPKDHPIYAEGPTITFVQPRSSRTRHSTPQTLADAPKPLPAGEVDAC